MTEEEIIRERMRNREEGEQLWRSMEKELEEYKKQSAEDRKRADEAEKKLLELQAKLAALEKQTSLLSLKIDPAILLAGSCFCIIRTTTS